MIKWNPLDPTSSEWVNGPGLSYKQSINASGIAPFSASVSINMGPTVMPATDTAPSTTFTSAFLNIFSNYSNPMVDNITNCINPFPYTFRNTYKVWVLWCPMTVGVPNQIVINYPLYPALLGNSFPLGLILAYGYSSTSGAMIGYRLDQNTVTLVQMCSVNKTTSYNINSTNPQ
jgi:hypothetical protein